jgi:hypothetical protein
VLGGFEDLDRDMFQQLFVRRQVTPLEIAGVVDQDIGVARLLANRGERARYRFARHQVELDDHRFAALLDDGLLQCRGIRGPTCRQDDEKTLPGEFLGDGAADAPADADGNRAVVEHLAVRQFGVASIGLPFGGCSNHNGDLLTGSAHEGFLARRCQLLAVLVTR